MFLEASVWRLEALPHSEYSEGKYSRGRSRRQVVPIRPVSATKPRRRKRVLLEYLFPSRSASTDTPIWIDSKDTNQYLTPRTLLQWSKRLALGLDRIGSKPGEVVMILTPNHIFVPVAYLGIVGSRRIFSGANPTYTVSGTLFEPLSSERWANQVQK
jgi:acyl-CoA synthetase (AMP-forming)/AMP-acid ligase II